MAIRSVSEHLPRPRRRTARRSSANPSRQLRVRIEPHRAPLVDQLSRCTPEGWRALVLRAPDGPYSPVDRGRVKVASKRTLRSLRVRSTEKT
jgi:hypothetical protein